MHGNRPAIHPLSVDIPPLSDEVFESMWRLFVHVGRFWQNMDDAGPLRSQLYSFMLNRISLRPIYREYYDCARRVTDELVARHGEDQAYALLFTDAEAGRSPPETPVALTRQKVANEFMAWQLALGGFKAWGAMNYCGYIGGPNLPGQPAPYRTSEDRHDQR